MFKYQLPQVMLDPDTGGGGNDPQNNPTPVSAENVTAFITSNPDYLNNILGTDLGKKAMQSEIDRSVTKGIETWKANNLDKIVNERVESLFPNETPQSKQLREMQQQIDKINAEKRNAELNSFTTQALVQEGVDVSFARFLQGADEATTRANISDFKHAFTTALNGTVDSKFKQFGHQPQNNTQNPAPAKDASNMTYQERMALYKSNPNEYNRLFG